MFEEFSYLAMLAFVIVASWGLEFFFNLRVLRNPLRLMRTLVFVIPPFVLWDWFAIAKGHWFFSADKMTGLFGPFGIPVEEYLFFIVIPIAAILTLEGVQVVLAFINKRFATKAALH